MEELLFILDLVVFAAVSAGIYLVAARSFHFTPNRFAWVIIGFYLIMSAVWVIFGITRESGLPWPDYRIREVGGDAFTLIIFAVPLALRKLQWLLVPLLYVVISQMSFIFYHFVIGDELSVNEYMVSDTKVLIIGAKALITIVAIVTSMHKIGSSNAHTDGAP